MTSDSKPTSGMPLPEAMAGNFQDAARWFSQFWSASLESAGAGRGPTGVMPSMFMPTLDIKELDKRIADLRGVEQWLTLNQNMLRTTIQGLEMQRQTLAAWQSLGTAASAPAGSPGGSAQTPGAAAASASPSGGGASVPPPAFNPAAWWSALQEQFVQLAANAAAQEAQRASESATPAASQSPAPDAAQSKPAKTKPPGKEKT